MRVVQRFITSARPDIVWQVLADVEHWREWTPTVVEIKSLSNNGMRVGTRYRVVHQNCVQPSTRLRSAFRTRHLRGCRSSPEAA